MLIVGIAARRQWASVVLTLLKCTYVFLPNDLYSVQRADGVVGSSVIYRRQYTHCFRLQSDHWFESDPGHFFFLHKLLRASRSLQYNRSRWCMETRLFSNGMRALVTAILQVSCRPDQSTPTGHQSTPADTVLVYRRQDRRALTEVPTSYLHTCSALPSLTLRFPFTCIPRNSHTPSH
jgi:hypothetical protein